MTKRGRDTKPKRASGGKRAVEAKRRAEAAARQRDGDYIAESQARYRLLAKRPKDAEGGHTWLAEVILTAIEDCALDPGMRPEQRREQLGRLVPQAVKALEPAKLTERLEELERALEELQKRKS